MSILRNWISHSNECVKFYFKINYCIQKKILSRDGLSALLVINVVGILHFILVLYYVTIEIHSTFIFFLIGFVELIVDENISFIKLSIIITIVYNTYIIKYKYITISFLLIFRDKTNA